MSYGQEKGVKPFAVENLDAGSPRVDHWRAFEDIERHRHARGAYPLPGKLVMRQR